MDANAGNGHDADLPALWGMVTPARETEAEREIRKPVRPAGAGPARAGVAGSVPLGGSVVFAWVDGSRRLHFAGDPLVVLPELEHTDAF
jgi:hypothetical protein